MANKILLTEMDGTPTQIVFADHATDFNPTAANDLRKTTDASQELDVQLDLTSLGAAAARQSAKFDFGEPRAERYHIRAVLEYAAGIDAGETVRLFLAPSHHATAANANPGNVSGADAAYTGYSSNLADALQHLMPIGTIRLTAQATATVQVVDVDDFTPPERYGSLVVVNDADDAMHNDAVEMHIVFDPIVAELQ